MARRCLRAEAVNLVEYPDWQNRGHGDFKDIRGVMVYHTGSDNATAASIANGRPDLPGLKVDGIVGPSTAAALRLQLLPPSEVHLMGDAAAS